MKDRRPGKLSGSILQAIDDGFVWQEDLGVATECQRHGTRLVPVADHARDLPPGLGPAPDVNEAERAAFLFSGLVVAEPMAADFHRAVCA